MWTTRTKVGWGFVLLGALLLVWASSRYYVVGPEGRFQPEGYDGHMPGLLLHISAMSVAVLAGPFQLLRSLRERHFGFHRALGTVYVVSALLGGLGGLYMAPFSAYGLGTHLAFTILGAGVLATTSIAFARIRGGDVQSHREWMTRSYALIFAAVTLRLYLPFLEAAFGEKVGYQIVAWACFVPNALFAEWLIRTRLRRHPEPPRWAPAAAPSPTPLT